MTLFHQFIPHGPDKAPDATSRIDRTQILDPKEFWRDPMACPDWPALRPNSVYNGQRGKAGAEARLEQLGQHLNRGSGTLRAPTDDEREQQFAATFRRTGSDWYEMGLNNLSPLGMMVESDAQFMAEACHVRGYLRKLAVKEEADAKAAEASKLSAARRALEDYRASAPAEIAEIEALAEAVARHKQRLEDERAVGRRYGLWQQLTARHAAAVNAAHTLGLGVPDAPAALEQ